jgi:hypothetical protein
VSKIETEKLLFDTISHELARARSEKRYRGKFSAQFHFFGYEGRSGLPSEFDSTYCYALGFAAACLVHNGQTGLMACVQARGKGFVVACVARARFRQECCSVTVCWRACVSRRISLHQCGSGGPVVCHCPR